MDAGLVAAILMASAVQTGAVARCLDCHGQQSARPVYVDPGKYKDSVHGSLECTVCHSTLQDYPHPKGVALPKCGSCHDEVQQQVSQSAHGSLGEQACSVCHGPAHEVRPGSKVNAGQCAVCHTDVVRDFRSSVHAAKRPGGPIFTCQSCHGVAHKILPASDPSSPVSKRNLPDTCGSCHSNPAFLLRYGIPFARPVESYRLSVHGQAILRGNTSAASCSDCHGEHAILPARDPRSRINHWNIPDTCGACHTEIKNTYWQSVHGQAVRRGAEGAPVCTDCHGEHAILAPSEPQSLVNPARLSTATCGRCHADERLERRYDLPTDRVPSFEDSFHGLALRAGSQSVANCASCHGVHNILPSSDPRSTVNPANLAATCGHCHPGAGTRFAIGPVHTGPGASSENVVVRWIRLIYLILIPVTIGFMLFHNLLDFGAKLVRGSPRPDDTRTVDRMNLQFRIAHWMVVFSFPVLVVSGFALKFPDQWWVRPLLTWESHFAFRGTVHRAAGVILIVAMAYHFFHLLGSRRDRIILRYLLPAMRDLKDIGQMIRYNLGLTSARPLFGKFSYAEKLEYWAGVWGTCIMAVSGLLLWFTDFTLRNFPKWVADAATTVHYYEAILATLSILLWHFYMVIFDPDVYPMDLAWLTGKASAEHLQHTRPAYYAQLLREQKVSSRPSEGEEKVEAAKPEEKGSESSSPPLTDKPG